MATRSVQTLGLRPKNSPSLTVLQQKKSVDSSVFIPSPSKSLRKASNPQTPIIFENKENVQTQTPLVETAEAACQTDVSACSPSPKITAADLEAEEPSMKYLRALMDSFEGEVESAHEKSLQLVAEEQDSMDELNRTQESLRVLKEVAADIEAEENEEEKTATTTD